MKHAPHALHEAAKGIAVGALNAPHQQEQEVFFAGHAHSIKTLNLHGHPPICPNNTGPQNTTVQKNNNVVSKRQQTDQHGVTLPRAPHGLKMSNLAGSRKKPKDISSSDIELSSTPLPISPIHVLYGSVDTIRHLTWPCGPATLLE